MTTNHPPWRWCQAEEEAFRNRIFILPFTQQCKDVPFTFRASEYSCKCSYCAASRGCTPSYGGASPGRLPTSNQPLSTGEHGYTGPSTSVDVGSGPLHGAGEGTSRSYYTERGSTICCTDPECTHTSEPERSSSTTISTIQRCGDDTRPSDTGNRIFDSLTLLAECVVSYDNSGNSRHDSRSDGSGQPRKHRVKRKHVTTGTTILQPDSSMPLGLQLENIQTQEIPIPPKEPRLDREMDALTIPTANDWKCYFSFLFSRYGK
uniref:Nonstructural protein n=1 Tax=Cygnus columbianus parvoviridae sp. TaxID=2794474 RepID=A0A8A4XE89_9VIRU|nr:MAG: nonstructural protein [Cygnus columbianus parvoviridae sp.]